MSPMQTGRLQLITGRGNFYSNLWNCFLRRGNPGSAAGSGLAPSHRFNMCFADRNETGSKTYHTCARASAAIRRSNSAGFTSLTAMMCK
jgi:hypothetical protein